MKRHLLHIDPVTHHWHLEALRVETLDQDPRQDYGFLSGEALCQYVLRRDADALIIARGPLPFLAGNKAAVGYVSPLTGLPHYSFVGGRAAAQLLNLGLDAVVLGSTGDHQPLASVYVVARGRAPNLKLDFRAADGLPSGQRGAFYWLRQQELEGDVHAGSIFTLGEAARLGYHTANVAVDAIYHAGRGGAGAVFARHAAALVLRGEPMTPADVFIGDDSAFGRNPNRAIAHLLERYCDRLSADSGGTITKLRDTGAGKEKTLPAWNARRLGTPAAALASPEVLRATRQGRTGCHWCPVDCRHFHYIEADYASEGRDLLLDDFEPTYALFAMLGLTPASDTPQAVVDLRAAVERRLVLPIEQMGCDVLDIGLGLAALFEGVNRGMIPRQDVPEAIIEGDLDNLEAATRAVALLRSGEARSYPGLRAVGDGPQALAERYPAAEEIVFTGGSGTLGNAGHANALWTFLMPFSRFF
ncbi:MAG: aldehyde ferredoxin oxidoreductase N-terminal domain-containing protein, partial [Anaerolineae bacterium]